VAGLHGSPFVGRRAHATVESLGSRLNDRGARLTIERVFPKMGI
jgi:hypothetical protein